MRDKTKMKPFELPARWIRAAVIGYTMGISPQTVMKTYGADEDIDESWILLAENLCRELSSRVEEKLEKERLNGERYAPGKLPN